MTFLLPILVAVALNFMGSIDMSSLGELHFGVLENDLSPQTVAWLERYGPVSVYGTREELTVAIQEPSTNVIGVEAEGDGLKTAIAGDGNPSHPLWAAGDSVTGGDQDAESSRPPGKRTRYLYPRCADRRYVHGLYLQRHEHHFRKGRWRGLCQRNSAHDAQPVHFTESRGRISLWQSVFHSNSLPLFPIILAEFRDDAGSDCSVVLCSSANWPVYRKVF